MLGSTINEIRNIGTNLGYGRNNSRKGSWNLGIAMVLLLGLTTNADAQSIDFDLAEMDSSRVVGRHQAVAPVEASSFAGSLEPHRFTDYGPNPAAVVSISDWDLTSAPHQADHDARRVETTSPPSPVPASEGDDQGPLIEVRARPPKGPDLDNEIAIPRVVVDESSVHAARIRRIRRLEIAYQVLNLVDTIQTHSCLSRNRCVEMNPLLGRRPTLFRLAATKLASGLLHFFLLRKLERTNDKAAEMVHTLSVGLQGGVVAWNMKQVF